MNKNPSKLRKIYVCGECFVMATSCVENEGWPASAAGVARSCQRDFAKEVCVCVVCVWHIMVHHLFSVWMCVSVCVCEWLCWATPESPHHHFVVVYRLVRHTHSRFALPESWKFIEFMYFKSCMLFHTPHLPSSISPQSRPRIFKHRQHTLPCYIMLTPLYIFTHTHRFHECMLRVKHVCGPSYEHRTSHITLFSISSRWMMDSHRAVAILGEENGSSAARSVFTIKSSNNRFLPRGVGGCVWLRVGSINTHTPCEG